MSNGKKWYNYFVSVDPESTGSQPPSGEGSAAARPGDAAQAIADIARSIQPAVDQRVEQRFQPPVAPNPAAQSPSGSAAALMAKPLAFNEIYSAAEIPASPHGYNILKVAEMLSSQHIKDLPSEVKRSSVMVALDAAGVKIQEIIEDAIRRDKALDAFERVGQKQVEDLEAAKLEENRKLQAELDKLTAEYKAKIQANTDTATKRRESFLTWRIEKQKEEQKIADTVSYFVTDNPITTSSRSGGSAPGSTNKAPGI